MDLRKIFPYSFRANDIKGLVITILLYMVADFICGLIVSFLGGLPLVGIAFRLIGWIAGVYFCVATILAVLNYFGAIKR
ncbi:MAG: hypothetical protein IKJ01_09790 [Lachnospiraceae bacterium]|nr:hypothetical protein [Lachnospiraceae bacterium]